MSIYKTFREFRLFIQSIKEGLFDDVKKYCQKEFLEKKHGSYLRYPIHYAVRYGHLEIINYLINHQCNIESVDFENIRPIHYACHYGTGDILKLFIQNKCDLESSDLISLESRIKSGMSHGEVIIYTKQMVEALTFLHEKTIVHRDIKPENILFFDENNLKLVDFGLSLMLTKTDGTTEKAVTFCGTKEYMAPEIINSDLYSCSVDIWSLGISVIYMVTGKIPLFKIWPTIKIEYQLPDSLTAYFKDLIDGMLIPDPEKRISAEHLSKKFENF